jgi:hypothetical protein
MAKRFLSNIRINDAYTFPASDGTNNQVIKTDGSGNLSFGQLAADSASVMYKDTFTGDGSTSVFSLANALNDEVQSNIYIDGVYQSKSTYSVSGTAITFSTAPLSGHEIEVISTTGINSGPTAIYTDTFTANGSATAFTLGQTVHSENQTIVFLNGVYQFKGTYTLSGTTLTLDTAPSNGVSIEVMSIGSAYSGGDILYDHDFTSAGLMTSNGSGVYSITANNSANWNTAYGWGDHSTQSYATQSYVGTQISNLVDSSPATLDTLNELAAALGDDPNFATTTANSIGTKLPLAGGTLTGDISIPDKLIHSGDTNTYLSFSGADNIKLVAGGKNVLHAHDNGNLYLYGNNGTALTLDGSQNATFAGTVQTTQITATNGLNYLKRNTDASLQLRSENTRSGLFITKPATDTVMGSALVLASDESYRLGTASYYHMVMLQNGNTYFNQNVGIGQTNPQFGLSMAQGTGDGNRIGWNDGAGDKRASIICSSSTDALQFHTGTSDTEKMRIGSDGSVTIGSSTLTGPRSLTLLSATNATNYDINFQQAGTTNYGRIRFTEGASDFQFVPQVGQGPNLTLQYGGNSFFSRGDVGIGTTLPSAKLQVSGDAYVTGQFGQGVTIANKLATYGAEFRSDGASAQIFFGRDGNNVGTGGIGADATYVMRVWKSDFSQPFVIEQGGSVGIGTTSPNDKLEVSGGNIRIYSTNNANHLIIKNNATGTSGTFEERIKFLGWNDNENASIIAKGNAYFGSPVNILAFSVSASEKMAINHSGNVAISGAGIQIDRPDVAGGKPYVFWKSGGTTQASIYGASGSSKGLRFFLEGGIADFNNNIKASGVYLGGSGSANLLDDYEEGTWTPVIQHNNGTGNVPLTIASARYVKVGDLVYISAWIDAFNTGGGGHAGTGAYYGIRGMPFIPENYGVWELAYASSGVTSYGGYSSAASLYFMHNGTNGQRSANHVNGAGVNAWGASQHFMMNCTYRVQ